MSTAVTELIPELVTNTPAESEMLLSLFFIIILVIPGSKSTHCFEKHADAVKAVMELNAIIKKLEKRNADLIDITSAAIKYHKGDTIESEEGEEMQKNMESTHSK